MLRSSCCGVAKMSSLDCSCSPPPGIETGTSEFQVSVVSVPPPKTTDYLRRQDQESVGKFMKL